MRLSSNKMRVGHIAQLGCTVCNPAQDPSHVGGPSMLPKGKLRGPYLFAAKALQVGTLHAAAGTHRHYCLNLSS